MSLSILTDDQIRLILESLTLQELEACRDKLKETLHDYSNGIQSAEDGAFQQPHRTSVQRKGVTTLFMPSSSPVGYGVKGECSYSPRYLGARLGVFDMSHLGDKREM